MGKRKRLNIFIVSDGTGATAESVLTSVMVQFRGVPFNVRRFPFTRTEEQLLEILEEAPRGQCIIVFTLVSERLRSLLLQHGKAKRLTVVDVMGPLIATFSKLLRYYPKMTPGLLQRQDNEISILSEAIHFTLSHDDGLGLETIDQADLIILGVSRTGKTPTSIYLSCRKLRVANVPIINPLPLADAVLKSKAKKVGFRISVDRLLQLRSERARRLPGGRIPRYASRRHLLAELEYCDQVYRRIPSLWTIDVTNRSIEEISDWITHRVL